MNIEVKVKIKVKVRVKVTANRELGQPGSQGSRPGPGMHAATGTRHVFA